MKQLSITLIIVLSLSLNYVANAQVSTTSSATSTRIEARVEKYEEDLIDTKTKIAQRMAEMQKRKEERKIKLEAKQKERVQELFENMFDGFANAAERLVNIDERLGKKIASLKLEGKDVTLAETAIGVASDSLAETMAQINATEDALSMAVEVGLSKETARELVSNSKDSIKKTHDLYKLVLETIKNLI